MNPVVSTTSSRLSRGLLVAIAATALASSDLHAQAAAPEKPIQFIAVGFTGTSRNDRTDGGFSGSYGVEVKRFYANVGLNYFSYEGGLTSLDSDYQLGYAFFRQVNAATNARHLFAITGGYYSPQEGDGSFMAALNGISGKYTSKFTLNAMVGWIFPEVGDPVLMFRGGLGFVF